jgi:flagellar motor component MotA
MEILTLYLVGVILLIIAGIWFAVMLKQDLKQIKVIEKAFAQFENEQKKRSDKRNRKNLN